MDKRMIRWQRGEALHYSACGHWVRGRPWAELLASFRARLAGGGPAFLPHVRFCEKMAVSGEGGRIHAITSMHTFILSNTPEFDSGCEVLRLGFAGGEAHLEYVEQPGVRSRWIRHYPEDQAFDAVLRLARVKRWFVEYDSPRT